MKRPNPFYFSMSLLVAAVKGLLLPEAANTQPSFTFFEVAVNGTWVLWWRKILGKIASFERQCGLI